MEGLFTPRRPRILKVGMVVLVTVLLLGGGVGFYLYIYPKLIKPNEESGEEPNRYFEGPEYYEEVNGGRRLLVVEGVVTEIDEEGLTITMEEQDYSIPREDIKEIVALSLNPEADQLSDPILSYEDLFVGLFISYNPSLGTIRVNASALNE
jgi:hypothetical protein